MIRRILHMILLCCVLGLSGCGLQGGALITPTPPDATVQPPTQPQPSPVAQREVLTLGMTEEPLDLYPYSATARSTAPLLELLYPAPLVVVDETYSTTGVLERVPTFENGDVAYITTTVYLDSSGVITQTQTDVISSVRQLTVTYRWNPDLRWADDTPVTAQDSLFAYDVLRQAATTAQLAIQSDLSFDYVALDEHTTRAYLPPNRDEPAFLETVWTPLPRHRFAADATATQVAAALARDPLGYGPYRLQTWAEGSMLEFERNDSAAANLPDQINVRLVPDLATLREEITAGRIDVGWTEQVPNDEVAALQAQVQAEQLQMWTTPTAVWEHIDVNLATVALQDIRMRHAIAYGFNRAALAETMYGSAAIVWNSWVAPTSWAYASDIATYAYDRAEAQRLLDEMNYRDTNGDGLREGPDGEPFNLTLTTSEQTPVRQAIAAQFVQDMAAIGLDIRIQTMPTRELYSQQGPLFQRQFQLALFGWIRGVDPDGAVLWSCAAIPNEVNGWSGNNFTGWCIDTADEAIRTATSMLNQSDRKAAYAEQQQVFTRELPVLPIFARQLTVLARPTLGGVEPQTFAPVTWNLRDWRR